MFVSLNIGFYCLLLFIEIFWWYFDDVMDYYFVYDVNSCGGNDLFLGVNFFFYLDDWFWGFYVVFFFKF